MKEIVTIDLNCTKPNCPNISDFIGDDPLYVYYKPQNIVLIPFYVPSFFLALFSNILVIIVVNRYKCLRSVTNYFLVNLSVADLLVTLVCMPMAIGQATYSVWVYGDFMCKLSNCLQGVAVSSSVFTITAMSLDRYMAIRHPMSRKTINPQRSIKIIAIIWVFAVTLFVPIFFIRKTQGFRFAWDVDSREFLYCVESWPDYLSQRSFGIFCFVFVYAIPGSIVVVAYSLMGLRLSSKQLLPEYQLTHRSSTGRESNRNDSSNVDLNNDIVKSSLPVCSSEEKLIQERRRLAKILLVLAIVFAFCWLPYSVLSLVLDLSSKTEAEGKGNTETNDVDDKLISIVTSILPFSLLLGHINSVVNPLLYCLLSKKFRRSVTDLICHPCRGFCSRQANKICTTFREDPNPSMELNNQQNKEIGAYPLRRRYSRDSPKAPVDLSKLCEDKVSPQKLSSQSSSPKTISFNDDFKLAVFGDNTNCYYHYRHYLHNNMALANGKIVVVPTVAQCSPNYSIRSGAITNENRALLASNHSFPSSPSSISKNNLKSLNAGGTSCTMKLSRVKSRKVRVLNTVSEESESYTSGVQKMQN